MVPNRLAECAWFPRRARLLTPDTHYMVIDGGVHGFFGDYGEQPGDGVPAVSREVGSAEIVAFTTAFLERMQRAG